MPQPNRDLVKLVDDPREALDIEVKEWMDLSNHTHRAKLAREIIALANHGGGYLVAGFTEAGDGTFKQYTGDMDLSSWSQDAIHSIIAKYVDPGFQCEVLLVTSSMSEPHPVIAVPGGHRVPVRAKAGSSDQSTLVANRVYIRRPGPNSEEPRSATEWDGLFERCLQNRKAELLEAMRSIMEGVAPSRPPTPTRFEELIEFEQKCARRWEELTEGTPLNSSPRLIHGHYDMSFAIEGSFKEQDLRELNETIRTATKNHSGWPPFVLIQRLPFSPRPVDGSIECWVGPDSDGSLDRPDHHDFWAVAQNGLLFTRRGYSEDSGQRGLQPGAYFDITTPTWRTGEAILQAYYIASALDAHDANLICHGKWSGLANRTLVSRGNPNRNIRDNWYTCAQNEYERSATVLVSAVPDALPEVVWSMLSSLYDLFNFFALPRTLVSQELDAMRRNTFR